MGEFSSIHLVIVAIVLCVYLAVPYLIYRAGKSGGDAVGYARGYKDGQQSIRDLK